MSRDGTQRNDDKNESIAMTNSTANINVATIRKINICFMVLRICVVMELLFLGYAFMSSIFNELPVAFFVCTIGFAGLTAVWGLGCLLLYQVKKLIAGVAAQTSDDIFFLLHLPPTYMFWGHIYIYIYIWWARFFGISSIFNDPLVFFVICVLFALFALFAIGLLMTVCVIYRLHSQPWKQILESLGVVFILLISPLFAALYPPGVYYLLSDTCMGLVGEMNRTLTQSGSSHRVRVSKGLKQTVCVLVWLFWITIMVPIPVFRVLFFIMVATTWVGFLKSVKNGAIALLGNSVTVTKKREWSYLGWLGIGVLIFFVTESGANLRIAANHGNIHAVKFNVSIGADVNVMSANGCTPLILAIDRGHAEIVSILASHGADVNAKTEKGNTPLGMAKSKGQTEVVEYLSAVR